MIVCLRKYLTLILLVGAVAACGGDDESDGGDGGDKPKSNPNPPKGEAVPSDFENSATSKTDLDTKAATVQTEIVDSSKNDLGVGTLAVGLMNHMIQGDGIPDGSSQVDGLDFSHFGGDIAVGDSCEGLYSLTAYADGLIDGLFSGLTSKAAIGDDLGADEAAATQAGYTVEAIDSEKYAWHIKMTPSSDSGLGALFSPAMEMAMGATDSEVAALFKTEMNFDSSDLQQGDSSGGGSQENNMVMAMATTMEMYANTETKSASISTDMTVKVEGNDKPVDMSMVADMTIQAGDNPSISQNMTMTGTQAGQAMDGFMDFSLSKVSEGTFKLEFSGSFADKAFDKAMTISGSSSNCTVDSVE